MSGIGGACPTSPAEALLKAIVRNLVDGLAPSQLVDWSGQEFVRFVVNRCRPDQLLAWSGPSFVEYLVALGWKPPTVFDREPIALPALPPQSSARASSRKKKRHESSINVRLIGKHHGRLDAVGLGPQPPQSPGGGQDKSREPSKQSSHGSRRERDRFVNPEGGAQSIGEGPSRGHQKDDKQKGDEHEAPQEDAPLGRESRRSPTSQEKDDVAVGVVSKLPADQVPWSRPSRHDLEALGTYAYLCTPVSQLEFGEGGKQTPIFIGDMLETNGNFSRVRWGYGAGIWFGGFGSPLGVDLVRGMPVPVLILRASGTVRFDKPPRDFPAHLPVSLHLGYFVGDSKAYENGLIETSEETFVCNAEGARDLGPRKILLETTLFGVAADSTVGLLARCSASSVSVVFENLEILITKG